MATFYVIGIGSKAQHGKDTTADFIKNMRDNVFIYHWADPLKLEARNLERENPLVKRCFDIDKNRWGYFILDVENDYKFYWEKDVPKLHSIMEDRDIDIYWGMNGNGFDELKDGPMLQFWGTDFRRNLFDQKYWVDKINSDINMLYNFNFDKDSEEDTYVLIPDTRFENEYNNVKDVWNNSELNCVGIYLNITRYNEDGTIFSSGDRDPKHPSEIGLDGVEPDYLIKNDGDLETLNAKVVNFLFDIEMKQVWSDDV